VRAPNVSSAAFFRILREFRNADEIGTLPFSGLSPTETMGSAGSDANRPAA